MLITKIAEYEVHEKDLEKVLELIRELVAAVNKEPGTHQYIAYQKPDKLSFIHFMVFENEATEIAHREAKHTEKFTKALYPLCSKEPVFTDLTKID